MTRRRRRRVGAWAASIIVALCTAGLTTSVSITVVQDGSTVTTTRS